MINIQPIITGICKKIRPYVSLADERYVNSFILSSYFKTSKGIYTKEQFSSLLPSNVSKEYNLNSVSIKHLIVEPDFLDANSLKEYTKYRGIMMIALGKSIMLNND